MFAKKRSVSSHICLLTWLCTAKLGKFRIVFDFLMIYNNYSNREIHANRFNCPGCDKAFNRHDNMKIHTKRCKPFLSNPSLKNFLSKKEKTESFSKADVTEYLKDGIRSNSTSPVEDQDKDLSAKAVGSKEKTEMKFCKLGLNISCIKSVNQTWTHSDVFSEAENFMRPTGINAIRITKFNDKLIPESEDLTVL